MKGHRKGRKTTAPKKKRVGKGKRGTKEGLAATDPDAAVPATRTPRPQHEKIVTCVRDTEITRVGTQPKLKIQKAKKHSEEVQGKAMRQDRLA